MKPASFYVWCYINYCIKYKKNITYLLKICYNNSKSTCFVEVE